MKRGVRRCCGAAIIALLFVSSCSDGPTEPQPSPGQLALHLTTPHADDAALLIRITAPAPPAAPTAVDPQTMIVTQQVNGATAALVIGRVAAGELLRFAVPDVNRIGDYSVTIMEVADAANAVRSTLTGYSAQLRVVR